MPDATPVLSEREIEIMRQVVTGLSNREIARNLDISPNTVKVHLRNIFEKLEVQSRTEATLYVLREGWVKVDNRVAVLNGLADNTASVITAERDIFEEPDSDAPDDTSKVPTAVVETPTRETVTVVAPTVVPPPVVADTPATLVTTSDATPAVVTTVLRSTPEVLPPLTPHPTKTPGWLLPLMGVGVVVLLLVVAVLLWQSMAKPPVTVAPTTDTNPSITYISEPSRWAQSTVLPSARSGVVAVKIGQNLVVAGGNIADAPTNEVWWFDSATQTWEARPPLPQAVTGAEAALSGGALVVVGGIDGNNAPITTVQRYSPQDDTWEEIAPLPTPLARGALVAFEGSLYYIGGWDGETIQSTILQLAPNTDAWESVGELPEPRADLAAVALPDGILLLGGVDENERPVNDVQHFSPNASTATAFRDEAPLPAPDSNPRVVALGSAVYLLGVQGFLERDPDQQWRSVAPPETPLPTDSAVVASDPYIIVIGGQRGNDTVDEVWQYQAIYRSFMPIVPNQGNSTTP